jgi:integrase
MEQEPRPRLLRVTDDSFAALITAFRQTSKWTRPQAEGGFAEGTKSNWARELDFMSRPDCLGALTIEEIDPSLVQAYFDGIDDRPGKQAIGLSALKLLEKWAVKRKLLPRQITLGIEISESDGSHVPWSDAHVALAEREADPSLARAVTLAANTGQRGSDLIRMGPTDIEVYKGIRGILVKHTQKVKREAWIPITTELSRAMATWERRPGPFLTQPDGSPWTRKQLSRAWTRERDTNPALAPLRLEALDLDPVVAPRRDGGLVIHGLRGTACVRLKRAGATELQICDMIVMSPGMVARYCQPSKQRDNAAAAVIHLDRTFAERRSGTGTEND